MLIPVPRNYPKPSVLKLKVLRWVKDREGNKLGTLMVGYDGSPENAVAKAKELTESADRLYPEISYIESSNGATDDYGRPRFIISDNFKIVEDVSIHKVAV